MAAYGSRFKGMITIIRTQRYDSKYHTCHTYINYESDLDYNCSIFVVHVPAFSFYVSILGGFRFQLFFFFSFSFCFSSRIFSIPVSVIVNEIIILFVVGNFPVRFG